MTTIGERLPVQGNSPRRHSDEVALGVIGAVVVFYVLGAAAGALSAQAHSVGPAFIAVPMLALLAVLVLQRPDPRATRR